MSSAAPSLQTGPENAVVRGPINDRRRGVGQEGPVRVLVISLPLQIPQPARPSSRSVQRPNRYMGAQWRIVAMENRFSGNSDTNIRVRAGKGKHDRLSRVKQDFSGHQANAGKKQQQRGEIKRIRGRPADTGGVLPSPAEGR